jgi:hypothetical protein
MPTYKIAYVVATNNGNEFTVKQNGHLGILTIETFSVSSAVPANATRDEFTTLNDLCLALLRLGVSREVLLPVFISVLVMIGLDVYSIDVKE